VRYGETGVNLEIDLSRGSIEKEESDPKLTELHLGGYGTGAKIIWDRVPPEVGPFSPDNLLIFGTGLLAGTPIPGANRAVVSTISPMTELHIHSMAGGFWAPALKHAGYDRIIIRGKSPSLVYLWINNDKVEIRDATHLQGKGAQETAKLIQQELKQDKAQVASIGAAGENRVYMASIEFGKSSASRGGCGAVMGDKNLKAVAVRGTKDINIARPAELFEFCNDIMKQMREDTDELTPEEQRGFVDLSSWGAPPELKFDDESFHTNNFSWGNARERRKDYWNEEVEKEWHDATVAVRERMVGCYNCPLTCTAVISIPGRQRYFLKCSKYVYAIAAKLGLDFAYRIFGINHEYGMDAFSTSQVLAFALELYEDGILTDKDMAGMPDDTEGRFLWLIDKVARREGIGDILANGTYRASRQIKGAEPYCHNTIKKMEDLPLKLEMLNYHYFLMYCINDKQTITQIRGTWPQPGWPPHQPLPSREEYIKDWIQVPDEKFKQYYLDEGVNKFPTIQAACDITEWSEMMHRLDDSTGICGGLSADCSKGLYHIHNIPHLISLATGIDLDEAGLWKIGKRNMTLVRAISVTRGIRRKDDRPPEDHWKRRFPETETELLDEYYKLKGWNKDGIPTKETLDDLGLDYVRKDLEQGGIFDNKGISNKKTPAKKKTPVRKGKN